MNPQNMLSEKSQTRQNTYSIHMEFRTGKPVMEIEIRMCSLGVGAGKWLERSIEEFSVSCFGGGDTDVLIVKIHQTQLQICAFYCIL